MIPTILWVGFAMLWVGFDGNLPAKRAQPIPKPSGIRRSEVRACSWVNLSHARDLRTPIPAIESDRFWRRSPPAAHPQSIVHLSGRPHNQSEPSDRHESWAATAITSRPRPVPIRDGTAAPGWESGAAISCSVQPLYDTTACCVVGGRAWNSLRANPARANMAWYSANV